MKNISEAERLDLVTEAFQDCLDEGKKDIIISGMPGIEAFMKKDGLVLMEWRSSYCFPMKKINGAPALVLREFEEWAAGHGVAGVPAHEITQVMLEMDFQKKKILAMESKPLNTLAEIKAFCGFDNLKIINLVRDFDSCPIKKNGRVFSVADRRDLALFLLENNIPFGRRPDITRSFFNTKKGNGLCYL